LVFQLLTPLLFRSSSTFSVFLYGVIVPFLYHLDL
jgi:hypothetical protein